MAEIMVFPSKFKRLNRATITNKNKIYKGTEKIVLSFESNLNILFNFVQR
jgi:hypothetical protein